MSQQDHGKTMDRPIPGSVRRGRERAEAGLPEVPLPLRQYQESLGSPGGDSVARPFFAPKPTASGPSGPLNPAAQSVEDVSRMSNFSRPTQAPQWPLPGPSIIPVSSEVSETNQSSERSRQAPRRPPRPDSVPSILDLSQTGEPIPLSNPRSDARESQQGLDEAYGILSPADDSSRHTVSSVGTIPDFPLPASVVSSGPPRKSTILGPPPSSRRGASSYYSSASFVSPIPEESPRSRSHGSYASSAAMPETWGSASPLPSPGDSDAFYDDSMTDRESMVDDFGDESRLVRSASIGKKGKPEIVTTRAAADNQTGTRPESPPQPFAGGTGYLDASTTSLSTAPTLKPTPATSLAGGQTGLTPDAILKAYAAASQSDPASSRVVTGSPRPPNRFSVLRRPPKLDINAVRVAEERGSLTSLPDLIRRATRLVSLIDKGKRPASRLDELNGFPNEKRKTRDGDGSLSDMLAAFPPPAHSPRNNRQSRASWARLSAWPVVANEAERSISRSESAPPDMRTEKQSRRRYCGLPLWLVVLLGILLLCGIIAAIVVPLEIFVFKNIPRGRQNDQGIENCRNSLKCLNDGTNVVSGGLCSCLCTNGFTGSDCGVSGSRGCTTSNIAAADGSASVTNVTLGGAIPRLVEEANSNFSIPLSGTAVMARINSAGLSCIAQNALVTFNGRSERAIQARDDVGSFNGNEPRGLLAVEELPLISRVGLNASGRRRWEPLQRRYLEPPTTTTSVPPIADKGPTSTPWDPNLSVTTTRSTAPPAPTPTDTFVATDVEVDFARVAVLFVAQEKDVETAATAQSWLQVFFDKAGQNQATRRQAASVNLGGNNRINLADFTVDVGRGPVGRRNVS